MVEMRNSKILFEKAKERFPGGVHSPARGEMKPYPYYIANAKGAWVKTIEGKKLIDNIMGYGAIILGHNNNELREHIKTSLSKGWLFGMPTEKEIEFGEKLIHYYDGEKIRFTVSGTEAVNLAIRLARYFTKRKYILLFRGCYHGWSDSVVGGVDILGKIRGNHAGVPEELVNYTLLAEFNSEQSVENIMDKYGEKIAAIIVEPVLGNMGVVLPTKNFLPFLRKISQKYGSLLIFDEVITGFRVGLKGAQGVFKVKPDVTILGKIIGGGFPIGAVCSQKSLMELVIPTGPVYHAGTFAAHPISIAAGLFVIKRLEKDKNVYRNANKACEQVEEYLKDEAKRLNIPITSARIGSMFQFYFSTEPILNVDILNKANLKLYETFKFLMIKNGVIIPTTNREVWFFSAAHQKYEIEKIQNAITKSLRYLKNKVIK
jgi:glutamate-1-semialdehyde 2,1-aminomutase